MQLKYVGECTDWRAAHIHFASFAVNQHHITWFDLADHLHDAFGIGVSTEREVLDLALDFERSLLINVDLLHSAHTCESYTLVSNKTNANEHTVDLALPARSLLPTVPTTQ